MSELGRSDTLGLPTLVARIMHLEAASSRPEAICDEAQLDEVLTRPAPRLIDFMRGVSSPLLILGAGGKMGPTLAVLARRAAEAAGNRIEVIAVSRFGDAAARRALEESGVRTISSDMMDREAIARLPSAGHIVYLVGLKFGTAQNPSATWATNTLVPAHVCERFPQTRIAAVSTGNVYPLSLVSRGGSVETDPLTPIGEYANAAVARERIFQHYSGRDGTRVALLRLCYAVDLRYGVLLDIARKVYEGVSIPLANGYFNCIWQGDANEMILRALSLAESPPSAWNLCRPEVFSVRDVGGRLGKLLGREPQFSGAESGTALLTNPTRICSALGEPATGLETMLQWAAGWVRSGGRDLAKPTHFEVRDGAY